MSPTIQWAAIEALFVATGRDIVEGKGSHLKAHGNGVMGFFARPHPAMEAKRHQIRAAREFLVKIGARPSAR
jgi:hypothetical protein